MERKVQVEALIKEKTESYIKIEIKIPYTRSMIESEELVQTGLNAGGLLASEEIISTFDTDGSNIKIGNVSLGLYNIYLICDFAWLDIMVY